MVNGQGAVVDGDVLTIGGQFKYGTDYIVEINPTTFIFDADLGTSGMWVRQGTDSSEDSSEISI